MNYTNLYSKYYNLFYSEKDYIKESNIIHEIINNKIDNRDNLDLLELACGSGKHAYHLAQFGYKILATDISNSMVELAIEENSEFSNITFEVKDMTKLDYNKNSIDVVYSMFDSLGYLLSNENIDKALMGVYSTLKSDGIFIFEVWHGSAFLRYYDPKRIRFFNTGEITVERHSNTTLDIENQIGIVEYEIFEKNKDVVLDSYKEIHRCRYFFAQELKFMLMKTGFSDCKIYPGFDIKRENITDNDFHLLIVASK